MKNTTLFLIILIGIMAAGFFIVAKSPSGYATKSALEYTKYGSSLSDNEVQTAKLKVVNGEYVLAPSVFKQGIPARIEADISNMPGCSKSVVIPAFNVRKTVSSTDNIIEFTPDKSGTFNIMCSMNMYRGQFEVAGDNGSSDYVEPQPAQSTGGCGCGG